MNKQAVWDARHASRYRRLKRWALMPWYKWRIRRIMARFVKEHPPIYWNGHMPKKQPCPKHRKWCQRTGPVYEGGCWYWCTICRDGFWVTHPAVLREIKRREQV